MDAFLPGVAGWENVYNNPSIWHFRFNGPTPEALVRGRERTYFEHFWNDFAADKSQSIPEADRAAYTVAYARLGRMRAGWAYFVSFQQAAEDFAELSRIKLPMPVFAIGGREGKRRIAWRANKDCRFERHGCCPQEHRTLGARRKSERDDRGTDELSLTVGQGLLCAVPRGEMP